MAGRKKRQPPNNHAGRSGAERAQRPSDESVDDLALVLAALVLAGEALVLAREAEAAEAGILQLKLLAGHILPGLLLVVGKDLDGAIHCLAAHLADLLLHLGQLLLVLEAVLAEALEDFLAVLVEIGRD